MSRSILHARHAARHAVCLAMVLTSVLATGSGASAAAPTSSPDETTSIVASETACAEEAPDETTALAMAAACDLDVAVQGSPEDPALVAEPDGRLRMELQAEPALETTSATTETTSTAVQRESFGFGPASLWAFRSDGQTFGPEVVGRSVGYCNPEAIVGDQYYDLLAEYCSSASAQRLVWRFDLQKLQGADAARVQSAVLYPKGYIAWISTSCDTPHVTQVYDLPAEVTDGGWNDELWTSDRHVGDIVSYGSADCGGTVWSEYAGENVTETVTDSVVSGDPNLHLGVKAADETCMECGFQVVGVRGTVMYIYLDPSVAAPTNLAITSNSATYCASGGHVAFASDFALHATVSAAEPVPAYGGSNYYDATFEIFDQAAPETIVWSGTSTGYSSGFSHTVNLRAGSFTQGKKYGFRVRSGITGGADGPTATCATTFSVDYTKPGTPQITPALGYPGVYSPLERGGPGVPGAFLVTPTGSDDVVKYVYGSSGCWGGREFAASGPVLFPFTPSSSGPGSFSVCAVDRAGNMSGEARVQFDVAYERTSSPPPVAVEIPAEVAAGTDLVARLTLSSDATYAHGAVTVAVDGVTVGTTTFDEMTETVNVGRLARGERQVAFTYRATPGSPATTITKKVLVGQQLQVSAHVQSIGWQTPVADGQVAGTTGRGLRVEALRFGLAGQGYPGGVEASAHVESYGWLPFAGTGDVIGTTGESKRVEAFKIRLTGELAEQYDVYYRTHAENFGWLGWAKNGESSGTAGYGYRLEAVQVQLVAKGGPAPDGSSGLAFHESSKASNQRVSVAAHVQNVGWMAPVAGGQTAGTEGRGLRVEALRFGVGGDVPGGIEASAHVQNLGWQPFAGTGGLVGTEGQGLRVEAFRIRLTGQLAETYDVYYRTHAQEFGWLGWAKNGEDSGTAGYAYRLEAVQVVLVPKGGPAPSGTGSAFYEK